MGHSWRILMMIAVLLVVILIGTFLQRMGIGEMALIFGFLGLAFAVESVRYVVRQFIKGYRNEENRYK